MSAESGPTGILAIDDHALLREGIAALVAGRSDMSLVAQASNGREAIRPAIAHRAREISRGLLRYLELARTKKGAYNHILGTLGSGGMGSVYRAGATALHRTMALKFLLEPIAHAEKVYKRLKRKASTVSAFDHRNIYCGVETMALQPMRVGIGFRDRRPASFPLQRSKGILS